MYKNLTGEESVHLADYPVADEGLIDEKLNEEMRRARLVVSLGLQLRAEAKIKVRQPLRSVTGPKFLEELFKIEAPEVASGTVEIKAIAREAGSRSKVAVMSNDPHIDPVGSMVGQRGVRVSTVMSELGGEKIDIIEWSVDPKKFIEDALSPAKVSSVEINESETKATVKVAEDQQSLAIGKGGQNVRLAAKLTNWRIDIQSEKGQIVDETESAPSDSKPEDSADKKNE